MKKNNLTTAIVAGLAGIAGIASTSNADVHVNNDGLGSALIFPYYTVNAPTGGEGLNTLISVVNTSNNVNAVKVRFLEGKNSREVLDFNLYLSPFDVWTAALIPNGAGGAKLVTFDNSCTVPTIPAGGVDFRPFAYDGNVGNADNLDSSIGRVREGHFEMIEMGAVTDNGSDNFATAATHDSSGVPDDCSVLTSAWNGGAWANDSTDGMDLAEGALFGSATIIDVEQATAISYNAQALGGFWFNNVASHNAPGNLFPSLNSGDSRSIVFDEASAGAIQTDWFSGAEAVSASFMRTNIYQEYVTSSSINAETSYVLTFPTKRFFVDPDFNGGFLGFDPFTTTVFAVFSNGAPAGFPACEPIGLTHWDREERVTDLELDFSPSIEQGGPVLCWETNIININSDGNISDVLYSNNANNLPLSFSEGWLNIGFDIQSTSFGRGINGTDIHTYDGLPVTGFSVVSYTNGSDASLLRNYASLFNHNYRKSITAP